MSQAEVDDVLEDVGVIFSTPVSLLKGKGGIRDAEVALARRVAWWVLKRRGLSLDAIGRIFSRRWDTVWSGVRAVEKELTGLCPPEWSIDVYPLAHISFEQALRWALRNCGVVENGPVYGYCMGTLAGHKRAAAPGTQLAGLRILADSPRIRKAVLWAFHAILGSTPDHSIRYHAAKTGIRYVE